MSIARRIGAAWNALTRNYDAAGGSSRWPPAAIISNQSSAALAARAVMGRKAAWLIANAPIAESIANVWTTNLVGDGPSVRSGHPNRAMRRALEDVWNKFYTRADIEGGDLASLLGRVVRALVSDGEEFVRLLTTARGELRLQVLSTAMVDAAINRELADGGVIVAGIERGPMSDVRAFHVLPHSPNGPFAMVGPAVRVDAADICHVFEPRFAGQVRGLSWLHAVATSILELDATQDAAIMKAKTTALLCGFIRDPEGSGGDDLAAGEISLEPGTLRRLRTGEDITFSPTSDMNGLNDFLKHMARTISSGAGVPYELITGDLSEVNYSSARVGLENFKRRCRAIRASVITARLLQPVWERLVTLEVLSGRLHAPDFARNPEPYFAASFLWPQWNSLDPAKETKADVEALNAGLCSRQEIIAARGRDPEEVDAEIAADTFVPRAAPQPPTPAIEEQVDAA